MPPLAPTAFEYVACDVPEDMTLDVWRRRGGHSGSRRARGVRSWLVALHIVAR
jgi:hypothetical protein